MAQASGRAAPFRDFAEQWMAEYSLDGSIIPDLITPDGVDLFPREKPCATAV